MNSVLERRRLRKFAHELVKLFENPVSNALGTSNLELSAVLESVLMARSDSGAEGVCVTSSSRFRGGINSEADGGGLRSRYNADPVQARSSSTSRAGRSPCVSVADTGAAWELQDRNTTSSRSNARNWKPMRGDTRRYKGTPQQPFSCCLFRVGRGLWCDRIATDSRTKHCEPISNKGCYSRR